MLLKLNVLKIFVVFLMLTKQMETPPISKALPQVGFLSTIFTIERARNWLTLERNEYILLPTLGYRFFSVVWVFAQCLWLRI